MIIGYHIRYFVKISRSPVSLTAVPYSRHSPLSYPVVNQVSVWSRILDRSLQSGSFSKVNFPRCLYVSNINFLLIDSWIETAQNNTPLIILALLTCHFQGVPISSTKGHLELHLDGPECPDGHGRVKNLED